MDDNMPGRRFPSQIYRAIRKGMFNLPTMEKQLVFDLRRLLKLIHGEQLSDLEVIYITEAIETVQEVVKETLAGFWGLRGFLSARVLDNLDQFEATLRDFVPEVGDEMRKEILILVRRYGGLGGMIDQYVASLEERNQLYAKSLRQMEICKRENLVEAVKNLENGLITIWKEYPKLISEVEFQSIAELVEFWTKLLENAQQAINDAGSYWEREDAKSYYLTMLEKLCFEYPHIAERMGLKTPGYGEDPNIAFGELPCDKISRHEVFCIIFAGVFCLVVVLIAIMCSRDCQG